MASIIIACQTIKREVQLAIKETGRDLPIILIESRLHDYPELLHQAIQRRIDQLENIDNILMAFGFCGSSLLGINSKGARIIIPRVDDCIPLMLGSYEGSKKLKHKEGTYFLTQGWMEFEHNPLAEYQSCIEKYGPEKARRVMRVMLRNYPRLAVIDTRAYQLEDILPVTKTFARQMGMSHQLFSGSLRLLRKLLRGPWDDEFIILEPGQKLTFEEMRLNLDNPALRQAY